MVATVTVDLASYQRETLRIAALEAALRDLLSDVEKHHTDHHRKPIEVVFPHVLAARAALQNSTS